MSVGHTDPLPLDVHEALVRLSAAAGLSPAEVLREAIDLYARELDERQAVESAERITPSQAELNAVIAKNPRPATWHDSDQPLF
jgi:predicted DNA-binding protein